MKPQLRDDTLFQPAQPAEAPALIDASTAEGIEPRRSPAEALQTRLMEYYECEAPVDGVWSARRRLAFLLGSASLSWAAIAMGIAYLI